jgi:hypothetical protein
LVTRLSVCRKRIMDGLEPLRGWLKDWPARKKLRQRRPAQAQFSLNATP